MSKVIIIPSDALDKLGSVKTKDDNYLLRKLLKALDPNKKKTEEKKEEKKNSHWSVEERILLGLLIAASWPLIGMAWYVMFETIKH